MTDHLANAGNPIPTLELVDALESAQAELLRSKAHAEMRRMDDEALLRQALEALEAAEFHAKRRTPDASIEVAVQPAITALRAALAEPAEQEPVAWPHVWGCRANAFGECDKGCTAPQPTAVPAESAIDAAYWDFDARHQGYGPHKTMPQSERDAFKGAVRAMLAAAPEAPQPTAVPAEDAIEAALVRAAALEEAAGVCDDKHDEWRFGDGEDAASGPKDCAAAIRQLKDKT